MTRLAVARLAFCSNSFSPALTQLADMQAQEWNAGDAAIEAAGPDDELRGVAAFVARRPGWSVSVLRAAAAPAGGPMSAALFRAWLSDVEVALRCGRFDAVYLSLHGAAQAEGDPIADITILRRVRAAVGRRPVVATFETSANLSDEVPLLLDGATGRRGLHERDPQRETGASAALRALALLEGVLLGRVRPIGAVVRAGAIRAADCETPPRLHAWGDMLGAKTPGVLDASLFTGFAWSDSPLAGPAALVWTDRDAGLARHVARAAAAGLEAWQDDAVPTAPAGTAEVEIVAALAARPAAGPTLLLDRADDPALGGLCDTPDLLRALLAAAGEARLALAALEDAAAVAACCAAGPGGVIERSLGGRLGDQFGAPVPVRGVVRQLSAGTDGAAAVLRVGALDVLLLARRPRCIDHALLLRCGLELQGLRVLALKGGEAARASLGDWPAAVAACDCRGPSQADLRSLPFRYVSLSRRSPGHLSGLRSFSGMVPGFGSPPMAGGGPASAGFRFDLPL